MNTIRFWFVGLLLVLVGVVSYAAYPFKALWVRFTTPKEERKEINGAVVGAYIMALIVLVAVLTSTAQVFPSAFASAALDGERDAVINKAVAVRNEGECASPYYVMGRTHDSEDVVRMAYNNSTLFTHTSKHGVRYAGCGNGTVVVVPSYIVAVSGSKVQYTHEDTVLSRIIDVIETVVATLTPSATPIVEGTPSATPTTTGTPVVTSTPSPTSTLAPTSTPIVVVTNTPAPTQATPAPTKEHKDCGVGNGIDGDTPGCQNGRNDGQGTGPGNPGSAGGNGNNNH